MKTWTERTGIVAAAGVLSTALNAPPGETQQLSSRAGAVPSGGLSGTTGSAGRGVAAPYIQLRACRKP